MHIDSRTLTTGIYFTPVYFDHDFKILAYIFTYIDYIACPSASPLKWSPESTFRRTPSAPTRKPPMFLQISPSFSIAQFRFHGADRNFLPRRNVAEKFYLQRLRFLLPNRLGVRLTGVIKPPKPQEHPFIITDR
jgi:hypothetical protein